MKSENGVTPGGESLRAGGPMLSVEQEVGRGMRFMHLIVLAIQRQNGETAQLVEELSKLLITRGTVTEAEWAESLRDPRSAKKAG